MPHTQAIRHRCAHPFQPAEGAKKAGAANKQHLQKNFYNRAKKTGPERFLTPLIRNFAYAPGMFR